MNDKIEFTLFIDQNKATTHYIEQKSPITVYIDTQNNQVLYIEQKFAVEKEL